MRLQLVELEDLPWWPRVVRDLATDYLHHVEYRFALHRPMVAPLADALRHTGARRLVDLCSGGSGPLPELLRELARAGCRVSAVLTDRFPNLGAFKAASAASGGAITYHAAPVDARDVPAELDGFRTIFNAFHHFRPADAIAILRSACQARQPIGVFELPQRSLKFFLALLFTPVFVLLWTPFIRPVRWERYLWTYLLPLVPLTSWWDGLVSVVRAYEPAELRDLAMAAGPQYRWQAARVPIGHMPGSLTYLIGVPEDPPHAAGRC